MKSSNNESSRKENSGIQESEDLNIKKHFFQHLYFVDVVKRLELTQEMPKNGFEETPICNLTLQCH